MAALSSLVVLSLATGLAGQATRGAQSQAGLGDGEAGNYAHVLEKVPFGSKRWWGIYEEQHGTPD